MTTDAIAAERGAEQFQPDLTAVRSEVTELEQKARTLIMQRPIVAVLGAVAVGYLVARFASRAGRWVL